MSLRHVIQTLRDDCYGRAAYIRNDVALNRLLYRDEGSLAWSLDNVRLAWAEVLEHLSGWAR